MQTTYTFTRVRVYVRDISFAAIAGGKNYPLTCTLLIARNNTVGHGLLAMLGYSQLGVHIYIRCDENDILISKCVWYRPLPNFVIWFRDKIQINPWMMKPLRKSHFHMRRLPGISPKSKCYNSLCILLISCRCSLSLCKYVCDFPSWYYTLDFKNSIL